MTQIELRDVEKYFGAVQVIKDLNLTIDDNEFVVLLGPSGCGKTTTLRAIAGLEDDRQRRHPHRRQAGADAAARRPRHRLRLPALSRSTRISPPTRTSPFRSGQRARARRRSTQRCARSPRRCRSSISSKLKPSALSGGDMQRVAIGRALVRRPKALLMDEPIGALDAKLREEMRTELKRLHIENDATTVYVTHDQVEAMALADRIAIMNEGVRPAGGRRRVHNRQRRGDMMASFSAMGPFGHVCERRRAPLTDLSTCRHARHGVWRRACRRSEVVPPLKLSIRKGRTSSCAQSAVSPAFASALG